MRGGKRKRELTASRKYISRPPGTISMMQIGLCRKRSKTYHRSFCKSRLKHTWPETESDQQRRKTSKFTESLMLSEFEKI